MSKGTVFWLIMIIWAIFGFAWHRGLVGTYGPLGGGVLLFVLFFLLGWHNFGFVIR